ncbi:MAG: EamA family transporter [Candidatus Woesearchaeota archaeon]|jgi:drug/metabolite transporter (DMT)-like permease
MNKLKQMHTALFLTILASFCFAFPAVFMKFLIKEMSPTTALTVRFFLAAILFPIIVFFMHKKHVWDIKFNDAKHFAVLGFILFGSTIALFYSFLYIPANMAMLIFITYPIVDSILAWIFLQEKITLPDWVAIALTLIGGYIIYGNQLTVHVLGYALAGIGTVFFAAFLVLSRKLSQHHTKDFHKRTAWLFVFTFIFFAIAELFESPTEILHISSQGWLWLVLLATVSTVVPYVCLSYGSGLLKSSVASLIVIFGHISSVGLVSIIFHETMTLNMYIGGALILFAFLITTIAEWESEEKRFHHGS